jgi:hypothetical protein
VWPHLNYLFFSPNLNSAISVDPPSPTQEAGISTQVHTFFSAIHAPFYILFLLQDELSSSLRALNEAVDRQQREFMTQQKEANTTQAVQTAQQETHAQHPPPQMPSRVNAEIQTEDPRPTQSVASAPPPQPDTKLNALAQVKIASLCSLLLFSIQTTLFHTHTQVVSEMHANLNAFEARTHQPQTPIPASLTHTPSFSGFSKAIIDIVAKLMGYLNQVWSTMSADLNRSNCVLLHSSLITARASLTRP